MKELIDAFGQHLQAALETVSLTELAPLPRKIDNVLITGLGGSGIGGRLASELLTPELKVPVLLNNNYTIPAFVGPHTLLIACSYSGNTEETLSALQAAEEQGAMVACISSGGKLRERAEERAYPLLTMEGGNPPRSMLGYSLVYLLSFFYRFELASNPAPSIEQAITRLNNEKARIMTEAEELARAIENKTVQLLANAGTLGVAARWRQQLNENAKMLAWEAEVPEMNHNELVGWEGGNENFAAVFLRNAHDHPRNLKRMEIIEEIIGAKTPHVFRVDSLGDSPIERACYLIHLGDWVSYFLAELKQVDIMDIHSIDRLKAELSKLPL